jgi:hypothetical protein
MHHEYEALDELSELAQGDLIRWEGGEYAPPWRTYGVIVTADCDLEYKKHRGSLSYIPALLTIDYLWHFWRPSEFAKSAREDAATMTLRLNKWREENTHPNALLSEEAIQSWLRRADRETILNELGVTDKGQRNTLAPVVDRAAQLFKLIHAETPDLAQLKESFSYVKKEYNSKPEVLYEAFQKSISSLPGDVFHLPVLPDNVDEGLFLMLRDITQCSLSDIANTPDDLRFGIAKARRVARVSAPYRYAITQSLSRVFADIGLPKAYEARCNNTASRFFAARANK